MPDPLESKQEEGLAASEDNLAEEEDEDEDEEDNEDDDDGDEEDNEDDDEDDDEPQYRRQRKRRKFVPPPPRELPQRTTRGRRMGTAAALQDEEANQEFWDQEFFAEEDQDEVYETESEPEDKFDADFLESEEGEEDEENVDQTEKELRQQERKKTLKPPGYKVQKGPVKSMQKKTSSTKEDMEQRKEKAVFIPTERTISVRESTRQRVQEAEDERKQMEASKPKKVVKPTSQRILTQAELLAEAARTEIENTKSLQYLVAIEEESKKKVDANRAKYVGPLIRLRSVGEGRRIQDANPALKAEDDASLGDEGTIIEEQTTLEVRNMQIPSFLQPQLAPAPAATPVCIITGRPAKYKDPVTGFPYADIGAYKELKRRYHSQPSHHPQQQQRLLSQQGWGLAVQAG